jgi:putative ABC transport system permease protein
MNTIIQIQKLTFLSLKGISSRWGNSLVAIVGIFGVVIVLVSILSLAAGLGCALRGSGQANRVLIMTAGTRSENESSLQRSDVLEIKNMLGGSPIAETYAMSTDLVSSIFLEKRAGGEGGYVQIRGVSAEFKTIYPEIAVVSGRAFRPGSNELMVGRLVHAQYSGMEVGNSVRIHDKNWIVVGLFEANGSMHESELIGDSEALLSTYQTEAFQSITIHMQHPRDIRDLKLALLKSQNLSVDVVPETEYYENQAKSLTSSIRFTAYSISAIMALGAFFAALNTMHSSVIGRRIEIATLRALGFSTFAVAFPIVAESVLLSVIGATAGVLVVWSFFDGNIAVSNQIVFPITITVSTLFDALVFALSIGLFGSFFPILRFLYRPVSAELRSH